MKQLLVSFCRYNLWANKKIIDTLQLLPNDIVDAQVNNSFTSIRKTIYHIWDAQVIWLSRMQGWIQRWLCRIWFIFHQAVWRYYSVCRNSTWKFFRIDLLLPGNKRERISNQEWRHCFTLHESFDLSPRTNYNYVAQFGSCHFTFNRFYRIQQECSRKLFRRKQISSNRIFG